MSEHPSPPESARPASPAGPASPASQAALRTHLRGRTVVIEVAGELDLAVEDEFERALRTAIAQRNLVIVDLTLVQFMDCAALGVLIAVRAALEAAAGRLCLVCAGTTVTRLLAAAGVSFPLAESVLEAQLLVDPPA